MCILHTVAPTSNFSFKRHSRRYTTSADEYVPCFAGDSYCAHKPLVNQVPIVIVITFLNSNANLVSLYNKKYRNIDHSLLPYHTVCFRFYFFCCISSEPIRHKLCITEWDPNCGDILICWFQAHESTTSCQVTATSGWEEALSSLWEMCRGSHQTVAVEHQSLTSL